MRVLFCCPPTDVSVGDMYRGYLAALRRAGHEVQECRPTPPKSKEAAESILLEAIYQRSDLVLFLCGIAFHPLALQILRYVGFKTVVLHTESPYQDDEQREWSAHDPKLHVFSHERVSCQRYGWTFLPHAYDPDVHRPADYSPDDACDVLLIGTGWRNRIALLESIDWTGIKLSLRGNWQIVNDASPLAKFVVRGRVPNAEAVKLYASAKICLNLHREDADALSPNPRAYELAACGAFQISDRREDGVRMFGPRVPTFTTGQELERLIRHYLAHDEERRHMADLAQRAVQGETFDRRIKTLMASVGLSFLTDAAPVVHGAR